MAYEIPPLNIISVSQKAPFVQRGSARRSRGRGIVALFDVSGSLVVEYRYDAWGAPTCIYSASTACDDLAFDNPFRYRGYVWDEESELYYLRSRYYDPELGRFLNADVNLGKIQKTLTHNLFCYCSNSPILNVAPDGLSPWLAPFYLKKFLTFGFMKARDAAKILTSDEQGYFVMEHWLNGMGKDVIIDNNPEWNQYFLDNFRF